MSVIINKIELCNWFNYKGEYETSTSFDFKPGLNILVGTNNAGKTKLHNAFRYLIENKIILNHRTDKGDVYKKVSIDQKNLIHIYNQAAFRELKNGETDKIGVKLTFTQERKNEDSAKYILTKEIVFRKDIANIELIDEKKFVQQVNEYTGGIRKVSIDFDKLVKSIIAPSYINFFLIEGEQMGLLTPLQGHELKRTINTIVNLKQLDDLVARTRIIDKRIEKEKRNLESQIENLTNKEKEGLEEINKLEDIIKLNVEEKIPENEEIININSELEEKYLSAHERAKENQKLAKKLNDLRSNEKIADSALDNFRHQLTEDYFHASTFSMSKLSEDNTIEKNLGSLLDSIKESYTERRTELSSKLSKKEEKMMMALEKSQPRPEILQIMVDESDCCYVCSNALGQKEKDYINDKLIPFFKGDEEKKDEELLKLDSIRGFISNLLYSSKSYILKDDDYFNSKVKKLESLTFNQIKAKEETNKFIQLNGDVESDEQDVISITTYAEAVKRKSIASEIIANLKEDNSLNREKIEKLKKVTSVEDKKSPKLKEAENLKMFTEILKSKLLTIKKDEYLLFGKELAIESTKRFQNLMRYNSTTSNQVIDVSTIEKSNDKFDFQINLINQFKETQDQSGGASSALKQLAVVFGLIDMADSKVGFPFIADAPLSRLTIDTKEAFFQTLIEDNVFNQCIIMTMDLWDNRSKTINKLGKEILKIVEKRSDTTFTTIVPNKDNKGVRVNYIK